LETSVSLAAHNPTAGYCTIAGAQGLAAHYDDHCVFVMQLWGNKAWLLRPPPAGCGIKGSLQCMGHAYHGQQQADCEECSTSNQSSDQSIAGNDNVGCRSQQEGKGHHRETICAQLCSKCQQNHLQRFPLSYLVKDLTVPELNE
jgi:hypothetical protein